jgi:tricorn protease-like protein
MRIFAVFVLVLVLSACQPQQPTLVLPTQLDINVISTSTAAAAAAHEETVAALIPPTLPPTWTPEAIIPPTPTTPPPPVEDAPVVDAIGAVYYIYNGDSIARVPADGSSGPELVQLATGIEDLTLSPDGTLLAYVAQGNGSAREIYISSLDGTYLQQITCLGYSRITEPTWSWDNARIAFFASQTSDGPMDVYTADIAGSSDCPTGNNQRPWTQIGSQQFDGMTWDTDGEHIYFSDYNLKVVNLRSGAVYDATQATGFGIDSRPHFNPYDGQLYFLRPRDTDQVGGHLFIQTVSDLEAGVEPPQPGGILGYYSTDIVLDRTGEELMVSTAAGEIFIFSLATGSPIQVAQSLVSMPPQPVFSPDSQQIAYIALGAVAPQIYIAPRLGGGAIVITSHTEGTVADIVWAEN